MSLIRELVKYSNKTYEKGFVAATDGNLSVRLDDNRIAITKSGLCKGDITESDIIIVDFNGNKLEGNGKPSSELKIHLLAYNTRKDINAVVHSHPIYATAFATANLDFTDPIFPEVILTIGPVHLCKYGTPSTEELPNSMLPFIQSSWAMILQNHGLVTFGSDLVSAYNRTEKLEHAAKTILVSKLLGGENVLTEEQVSKLNSIAEKTWGIKPLSKWHNSNNKFNKYKISSSKKQGVNYSEIIEENLRARAGNSVFNNSYITQKNRKHNFSEELISTLLLDFKR